MIGPLLSQVTGEDAALITRDAVNILGGMSAYVAKGDKVLVKPNIGWDRTPQLGACTNPDVVKALVEMCVEAGAKTVTVMDNPCNPARRTYVRSGIAKAAKNVILESKSFDPELVFKTIQEHQITNMFAAPTMVKVLIDHPAADKYNHDSLKAVVYGGAPMYVEDLKAALRKLGPCLVQLYGQGESPMTITYLSQADHVLEGTPQQMGRLASAGMQRTDVEVTIFNEEDKELPPGQVGEIVTRSDLVMKGYWRNPEATSETLRNGWLHTGDVGYMDDQGYLFIMDRSKDMIISGGENLYPREIEEVIIKHPAVREVAVIGVPDPKWGEAVKAVVSLVPGGFVTEEEVIAFCKEYIASYKKPQSVDFVDELPKNNYGKILKRELRERYWRDRGRKIV